MFVRSLGLTSLNHGLGWPIVPSALVTHIRSRSPGAPLPASLIFWPSATPAGMRAWMVRELIARPLFDEDLVLVVPSEHPFAGRAEVELTETDGLALLLPARIAGTAGTFVGAQVSNSANIGRRRAAVSPVGIIRPPWRA